MNSDVKRVFNLAIAEDVRYSLQPGQSDRNVIVFIDIVHELTQFNRLARAATYVAKGDLEPGQRQVVVFWQEALRVAQRDQSKREEAIALAGLGNLYFDLKEYELALNSYESLIPIFDELELPFFRAKAHTKVAEVYRKSGKPEQAVVIYGQVLPVWDDWYRNPDKFNLQSEFVEIFDSEFSEPFKDFFQDFSRFFSSFFKAFVTTALGTSYGDLGDYQQALYFIDQAQSLSREFGLMVEEYVKNSNNQESQTALLHKYPRSLK